MDLPTPVWPLPPPALKAPGTVRDLGWVPGIGRKDRQCYVMEWTATKGGIQYCVDEWMSQEEYDALSVPHPSKLLWARLVNRVNALHEEGKLFPES